MQHFTSEVPIMRCFEPAQLAPNYLGHGDTHGRAGVQPPGRLRRYNDTHSSSAPFPLLQYSQWPMQYFQEPPLDQPSRGRGRDKKKRPRQRRAKGQGRGRGPPHSCGRRCGPGRWSRCPGMVSSLSSCRLFQSGDAFNGLPRRGGR
jgi:hypothetical protein